MADERKYEVALLLTVCVWGVNFAVVKAALAVMHPHVLNLFRFAVSTVVLGGLYVRHQHRARQPLWQPLREYAGRIVALGLLGFFFYQYCFIVGVDNTTAGSAALIMASAPLWTAVIGALFGIERLRRFAWGGLLVTFMGTLLIVLGGSKDVSFGNEVFLGNMFMLAAALLWGSYTAFNRPMSRRVAPIGIAFLGLVVALPLLIGLGVPHLATVEWHRVTVWVWLAILFSGGLSTGLAVVIWNAAVKNVGASHTAAYSNLVPVIGLLSGVLFLGESVTLLQIAGGALIIAGLVVMRRYRRREHIEAAPQVH